MSLCVIYIRVSDEKQTRGASLSDQERTCRTFAARAGLKVVAVYRDDGKSAWKDDLRHRPQFEQAPDYDTPVFTDDNHTFAGMPPGTVPIGNANAK